LHTAVDSALAESVRCTRMPLPASEPLSEAELVRSDEAKSTIRETMGKL
jgi:hypothetical protein